MVMTRQLKLEASLALRKRQDCKSFLHQPYCLMYIVYALAIALVPFLFYRAAVYEFIL